MKSIGLTGGLGAGKSTALRFFYELGANTMNADDIAKHLLKSNLPLIRQVKEVFGDDCYADDELQTAVLAERAFCSKEQQEKLNAIVHPPLREYIQKYLAACKSIPGVMIVEAALLLEAGYRDMFETIILVTAEDNIRIRRAKEKGNISESGIRNRMELQMPEAEKRKLADIVIENNEAPEILKTACLRVWEEISKGSR